MHRISSYSFLASCIIAVLCYSVVSSAQPTSQAITSKAVVKADDRKMLLDDTDGYIKVHGADQAVRELTVIINTAALGKNELADAIIGRGIAYGYQGKSAEALRDFSSVIESVNDQPAGVYKTIEALIMRADYYAASEKPTEAIADVIAANKLNFRRERTYTRLINYARESTIINHSVLYLTTLINQKDVPAELLSKGYLHRGVAYKMLKQYDKAALDFSAAIDVKGAPDEVCADALYNRSIIHFKQSQLNDAVNDLSRAISLKHIRTDQRLEALQKRGICFQLLHKYDEALQDFSAVIDSKDGDDKHLVLAAVLHRGAVRMGQKKCIEAIKEFDVILNSKDQYSDLVDYALFYRAASNNRLDHKVEAIADYRKLLNRKDVNAQLKMDTKVIIADLEKELEERKQP